MIWSVHYSPPIAVLINGEDNLLTCQLLSLDKRAAELYSQSYSHATCAAPSDGLELTGSRCRPSLLDTTELSAHKSHVLTLTHGRLEVILRLVRCSWRNI